jgi:hypothetical protein
VLWDNPAVTDVRVGAGEPETIPTGQFFDERGQPGGLTARYSVIRRGIPIRRR